MENTEEISSLMAISAENLRTHILNSYTQPQSELLVQKLECLERYLDKEILSIIVKHKPLILEELQTVKSIKKAYDSPALSIKINAFDEKTTSLANSYLSVFEKLKTDVSEFEKTEEELTELEKEIKIEQLISKFDHSEIKFDYKLVGQ